MRLLLHILAAILPVVPALAEDAIVLRWGDLIPAQAAPNPVDDLKERLGLTEQDRSLTTPNGVVQHGQNVDIPGGGAEVVTTYNGRTVTLSGFAIPLDYSAKGASSFMLVPFVGACIHVPPPPPNQLVFVTVADPMQMEGLFDPYTVTGTLGTATTQTQLAEVGYTMAATTVELFEPAR